jgi:outer membrane protein assembly factor BamA
MLRATEKLRTTGCIEIAEETGTNVLLNLLSLSLSSSSRALRSIIFLFLCFTCIFSSVGVAAVVPAQTQDPAKILASVKIKGTKRFNEEDVIAASGLQIGRAVSDEEFKKAARTLGDTGAFTDIAYSFTYSSAGTRLELQLSDAAKFLPARFEDFVWFTDDQLDKAIRAHAPLFHGELPAFGRMADEVSDALQTLLVQNSIPGRVDYLRTPGAGGDIESFNYSVADVLVRIRNIEFTGIAATEAPLLEAAAQKMLDREYSRSRMNALVERQLLPILRARGFLKASFGLPQPIVVKGASESNSEANGAEAAANNEETRHRTIVDVHLAAVQGLQYKLSGVDWSGNHEFSTEQLQAMVHLKPGQPANMVQLGENLAEVRTLYGSRGYVNATVKIDAQFDDAASAVKLRIEVKEDSVYHMGDLEFRGLDNSLTAKLREAWRIRQGEVFDATYLDQYLPVAHKLLPTSLDWEVVSHVTPNIRDKTVDVDLQYSVKAPK